jgi:hypothetical protein
MQNIELTWENIPNVAVWVLIFLDRLWKKMNFWGSHGFLSSGARRNLLDMLYHNVLFLKSFSTRPRAARQKKGHVAKANFHPYSWHPSE